MVGRYDGVDAWNYTYDPGNRLTAVLKEGVAQGRFWYDADGRRVRLWDVVDGFTDHVYSGLYVVYEENATIFTKHFYANGLHFAENRSGTVEFFHQDHLGSTRLKTNSTCGVVYDTNHVPFGPDQGEAGSEEFKYTGKQEDATGLYYYWARYYDPETGRFITEDLVKGILEDQQNLKRYVYCYYNP